MTIKSVVFTLNGTSTTRTVDSGTFEVYDPDGDLTSSGVLSIDEDGHTCSFHFTAEEAGMHRIVVAWRMGNDAWKQPHLLMIEDASS